MTDGVRAQINDWLKVADKFIDDGDPRGARACAHEILELNNDCADGFALMAECALYFEELDEAYRNALHALELDTNNLRARLVTGGIAAERFELDIELPILRSVAKDARERSDNNILFKALTWLSNGLYLAGAPEGAAECLLEAADLKDNRAVELYGKYLFYLNYRQAASKDKAARYQTFFDDIKPVERKAMPSNKIKLGYISPDFRQHAVANFVEPFLKHFDAQKFQVTCYSTGKADAVTKRLKKNKIRWRDLKDNSPLESARIIAADGIDILIDLSGHSQNSCLPILAYRPARIQISAIGYVATTGLNAVDYFLSDVYCAPPTVDFTEKILRMPDCHMCYAPFAQMPNIKTVERDRIVFGSFNNFSKISDRVLGLWKAILDGVDGARLIIKAKTCSIPSGCEIVRRRLKDVGIDINRVELRPFSADYLEQYNDVDIALDAFPYNGGLTTCEALYMGVPVIALKGRTHGDRIAASLLHSARKDELIAQSEDDYIKKAVDLAGAPDRLKYYRSTLRQALKVSPLMIQSLYMKNFETILEDIF